MNKSESKYFNTARKMDKAFLELLEKRSLRILRLKKSAKKLK